MPRVLSRVLVDAVFIALLLFASAGTTHWNRAWVLLLVLLVVRIATAIVVYRVNPDLMRERAKPPIRAGQPFADKLLVSAVLVTGFGAIPIVAGSDVFRWHLLPQPSAAVANLGMVLFVAGWVLKGFVLRSNAFAAAAVHVQAERGHTVIDHGVYGVIRHPFYAGTLLVFSGMSLWLGSFAALLFAVVPAVLVAARIVIEERFLNRELAGYTEYTERVRHRLIPGVW